MIINTIFSNLTFAFGLVEPFIKLLGEDNNDDEVKSNDVLYLLSFSSNPSCDSSESNSPLTTNPFSIIAKSSLNFIRSFVMESISGCIKALPLPVKSFVVTSIGQLTPLLDTIASSGILGIVKDDDLLRLPISIDSTFVATTTSKLVLASSTDIVAANDRASLAGMDDEESYHLPALSFVFTGCLIILLAFGCGIIRSDTTILCLSIFQAAILEYNYQMISLFGAVMMKYLVVIFASSNDVDSADKDRELAESIRSSSLRLDMSSSAASNELIVPIDVTAAIVDHSNSSDASIEVYKSCLLSFLLLIFASMVGIVDVLLVGDRIDWLELVTLVGSMMIISPASKQLLGSDVETTINTSVSSASSDDIDTYHPASRYADDTQSQSETTSTSSNLQQVVTVDVTDLAVSFNLGNLQACLSSRLQHIYHERHSLLLAFLFMASTPLPLLTAVLMVLDFWTVLQSLVVVTCLIYATTYISKALQSIPTCLRCSTSASNDRVYRLNTITTICNIITDESCLLTLLLMMIVPLMGIVVIMMMLIVASFDWLVVVQVLAECTMTILSCVPNARQACGVVMYMMCFKIITYYLLRLWQYQLLIAIDFLDVIGLSGPLVNIMSRLFDCISYALRYYDGGGGGLMNAAQDMLYSATIYIVKSVWVVLTWVASIVVKKLVYFIASKTSILLVRVCIMLVWTIDIKTAVYTLVAYLIWLPINIIWRCLGRVTGAFVFSYTNIKLFIIKPSNRVKQKEPLPPDTVAISDDEDSDDDSIIDFDAADPIDNCVDVDQDVPLHPPPPPKPRIHRPRKKYPPAVWHRGRGGRGGRLRPRTQPG